MCSFVIGSNNSTKPLDLLNPEKNSFQSSETFNAPLLNFEFLIGE